jgi:hypothetical protein
MTEPTRYILSSTVHSRLRRRGRFESAAAVVSHSFTILRRSYDPCGSRWNYYQRIYQPERTDHDDNYRSSYTRSTAALYDSLWFNHGWPGSERY